MNASQSSDNTGSRRLVWLILAGVLILMPILGRKGYEVWETRTVANYKTRCQSALQDEDWETLIGVAKGWQQWQPLAADPWLFLAEGYLQSGDPREATSCLERIPRDSPKAVPALIKKSQIEFDVLNLPLVSEETCLEVLKLEPRAVEIHTRLIFFYALSLQRVKLIDQIQQSIEMGAEPPEAYVSLMLCDHLYFTNGYQVNSRWLKSTPNSELFRVAAAVQFDEILQKLENQTEETLTTRQESQAKLDRYLVDYPGNSILLRYFLQRYAEESNVNEVARILTLVPPDVGNDSVFWRFRGWYQVAVNELDQAEEAYRKSLELMRLDWRTWQGLSEVLRLQGKLEEADRCQRNALTGKQLRQELLQLPTAQDITEEQLQKLSDYSRACGKPELADHLLYRLRQRGVMEAGQEPR